MILQKYMAGINSLIIVVLSALVAIPSGMLNWTSGAQLASITISGIGLYIFPLLDVKWKGVLKTGTAILGAFAATAFPLFQSVVDGQPWRPIYVALIALAAAHALSVQLGVDVRVDTGILIKDETPLDTGVIQTVNLSDTDRTLLSNQLAIAPGTFAVGAGQQETNVPYSPPVIVEEDTASLEAVNPANQDDDEVSTQ